MQAPDHLDLQQTEPGIATKGLLDSGYSSQESFVMAPNANDKDSAPCPEYGSSPGKNHLTELAKSCGISKSDSTTSSRTHKSISVTGAYPLGTLHIHTVDETPEPSDPDRDPMDESMAVASSPPAPPPKCLENGDCFIIIGLPNKFTVGLDTIALTTSNDRDFRGFRDIPPGPHFLWMSEPGAISRCGYWFVTGPRGEVRVKQWDYYNEVLGVAASHFDELEQKKNIETICPTLMPHNFQGDAASTITPPPVPPKDHQPRRGSVPDPDPDFTADNLSIWQQLTSAITPSFLSRVTGKKTVSEWLVDTTDGARGDIPHDPTKLIKSIVGSQFDFLFQQDIVDLQLLNITAGHKVEDTTPRILALLNNNNHDIAESDILAELQFTFLTGLHLGNYTSIEQWWHLLLKILLRAHGLVLLRPDFVRSMLQTFHAQLVYNDRYIDQAAAAESSSNHHHTQPSHSTDPYHTTSSASAVDKADREEEGSTNSILDTIPRNKTKLKEALTVYKRRLNQMLLREGRGITLEQGGVGKAFADLEAWFWRFGWDLRSDYRDAEETVAPVNGRRRERRRMVMSDGDSSEDEDDAPAVVELDENGREVGLVSFNY